MIKSFEATLTKRETLTQDMTLFSFEIVNDSLEFLAGQYVILMIKKADGEIARRLYSLSSESQNAKSFDLLVQLIPNGVGSTYLESLKVGEKASFQGPAGVFTLGQAHGKPKVFLATGSGIAPIYSMLKSRVLDGVTAEKWNLFWGVRTSKDLYWIKEFEELKEKNPLFDYVFCLSREVAVSAETMPEEFVKGRINTALNKELVQEGTEYYICGSVEAVDSLRQLLLSEGIEKKQIHFEKFV